MNNLRSLLAASALLSLAAMSAANAAPAAGSYKLAIGSKAPCPLTLAADGTASYAGDCAFGGHVARWTSKAESVELLTASGQVVAVLNPKDGGYAGTRYDDGRSLVLSADGNAVAMSH